MKFSNKLSSIIFITGTIVLILLSFTAYKLSYNSILKSQFTYTESIVKEVSGDIDQLLNEKVKKALTLANTPILIKGLETSNFSYANQSDEKRKESINLLNERWKATKDLADNFILKFIDNKVALFLKDQQAILKDEYGEIFLTNKFGALVASTSKLSTFAHGHKYWWLGSYNNGKGAVFFDDRGYDDSVGGYVLGLVVPIRKGTEIIGILKCNLNILGSINQLISGAEDKLIGRFKLVRSGGMVVFEEGFEPLSTQVHDSIFKKLKSKNTEPFVINNSGKKYLVGISEIKMTKGEKGYGFGGTFESIDHKKGNTGESWHVVCYRPMSLVLSPITESIKSIILIGVSMILILVLVSFLFGRKISKPLAILDNAIEKIGKGNFEYRIDMERNDEFGNLAHSFNSMVSRLQQTTISIELLRESEKRYRSMLESMIDSVYICSPDFRIEFMNSAMVKRIGRDATGEVCHKVMYDLDEKCPWCVHEKVMQDECAAYTMVSPKDNRSYHITHSPIAHVDGSFSKLSVVRDITESKKAEEERINHVKLQAVLETAGAACHELNQPIQTISGYSELLSMGISEKSPHYEKVRKIKEQIDRMGKITARLMGITRYETKVYTGENNIIDLDNVRERRKYKRFIPSIRTFVIPQTDSPQKHQMIDISIGGLSFWCNGSQDQLGKFDELSINMIDGGFILDKIPCNVILNSETDNILQLSDKKTKRCCIEFEKLTRKQIGQVEYFIHNHTTT